MNPQILFERILELFSRGPAEAEIRRARAEFFARIPDLREDDPCYEALMSGFLEWFVFERPQDGGTATPLQAFARERSLSEDECRTLREMAASWHSLFLVRALDEHGTQLEDVFLRERVKVSERRALVGLEGGLLLEARVLPQGDRWFFFGSAVVVHPRAANRLILAAVEKRRRTGRPTAAELMRGFRELNFRYLDRYRQRVAVEKVYGEWESFIASRSS